MIELFVGAVIVGAIFGIIALINTFPIVGVVLGWFVGSILTLFVCWVVGCATMHSNTGRRSDWP